MTPKKSLEEILTPADQTGIPGLIKDSGGRFQHISKIKLILLDFRFYWLQQADMDHWRNLLHCYVLRFQSSWLQDLIFGIFVLYHLICSQRSRWFR